MQINTNGQRNITLDFDAPKKFKLKKDGAEIPYIRTGKNSFRLGRNIDGVLDLEEVIEQPRYMQPVQLKPQQMTVINPQDVERLNEAVRQMALVNPNDVMIINQTAEQLEKNQNFIAQTQKEITDNQVYIDQQQQRLNESALGIQALETNNSQRLDSAETAIYSLTSEVENTKSAVIDGLNATLGKIDKQGAILQAEIDTKADKEELESLKKDIEEKSDQFSNAMASYSGGYAYDTLPRGGEAGKILAKRTDRQGDYVWIEQTPVIVKSETIPTASEKYKGDVYQYVGETGEYTHGYIYECQQNGTSYEWVRLDVQPNTAVWGQITGLLSDQTDLQEALDDKQDTLVSGTNIKTINNTSILGSGNIDIAGKQILYSTTGNNTDGAMTQKATTTELNNKADVDLSNLTTKGQNIANWSTNVTNCITEIPQDIKLELNNGTLTLKAGSTYYKCDGSFTKVTTSQDYSKTNLSNGYRLVFFTGNGFDTPLVQDCNSGTSEPTTGNKWFNTSNYILYSGGSGNWQQKTNYSLPLAIITVSDGTITSIDQVFNGFGYIGSAVFALPGVKGLMPNGINADGSLKNREHTIPSVRVATSNYTANDILVAINSQNIHIIKKDTWIYNEKTNYFENTSGGKSLHFYIAECVLNSGTISQFNPKKVFRIPEYQNENINVKNFGAKGDGVTDDTSSIQAAIDSGEGYILFDNGTYVCSTLVLKKNRILKGKGATTVIRLKANTNAPLIESYNFASYYNSTFDENTPINFGFENMIIDGNRANQTVLSQLVKVCGWNLSIHDVLITEAYGVGLLTASTYMPVVWNNDSYGIPKNIDNLRITKCTQEHWIFEGPADLKCGQIHTNICGDDANVTTSSWFSGEEIASVRVKNASFHAEYLNLNVVHRGRAFYDYGGRLDIGTLITSGCWGGSYFESCYGNVEYIYAQNNTISISSIVKPFVEVNTKNMNFGCIYIRRRDADQTAAVGVLDRYGSNYFDLIRSNQALTSLGTLVKVSGAFSTFGKIVGLGCDVVLETDTENVNFDICASNCNTIWKNDSSRCKGVWKIYGHLESGQNWESGVTTGTTVNIQSLRDAEITIIQNNTLKRNRFETSKTFDITASGQKTYKIDYTMVRKPTLEEIQANILLMGVATFPKNVSLYVTGVDDTQVQIRADVGTAGSATTSKIMIKIN